MKKDTVNLGKEVYKELRTQSWKFLWEKEVPLFNAGTPDYRSKRVGLVRALGVVALKASAAERKQTRQWLLGLLQDPQEKIRRYAMNALPKLGGGQESEEALLSLLERPAGEREVNHLSRSLDKIGGAATLEKLEHLQDRNEALHRTEQKVKAQLARDDEPAQVLLNVSIRKTRGLRIHLRSRRGLEPFVRDELLAHPTLKSRFKLLRVSPACVALAPNGPFSLADLYQLRTFASIHFVLGVVAKDEANQAAALAQIIASKQTQRLCSKLTDGRPRYRLEFIRQKASVGKLQAVVNQAFTLCPDLLNDPKQSPWAIEVYPEKIGQSVELRPRVIPDPRFLYRVDDVPASTHPPLAAAMAQLAGLKAQEVVWDPFCGSGQELVERGLLGRVKTLIASDIDEKATEIARLNLESAGPVSESVAIHCCDFRDYQKHTNIKRGSLSLILANPPLGRRVRVADLKGLISDFYEVAAETLRPGGRLVFINPVKLDSPDASLTLQERHRVDLGGFNCFVEKWIKS